MDTALIIDQIAGLIGEARHVATGALSPIPAAAAMLARRRNEGRTRVTLLGSRKFSHYTDGARELFDSAAQGRMDVFFLSGAQIDGEANVNLVSIGDYERPKARFSGSFGSPYLYMLVPRVILFRLEHTPRTLVRKVDFVSAPGWSAPEVYRPGGPAALITRRCLFDWDKTARRFRLRSVHLGETAESVRAATGFDYDAPPEVPVTPSPDDDARKLIRAVVREDIAESYPRFAAEYDG